jgi:hypothetical protein
VSVNCSASSEYFFDSFAFFSSATISALAASSGLTAFGLTE